MTNTPARPKALNITLWIVQLLLAASLLWAAWMKLMTPIDKLAAMWPWAGQVSPALVKFTGTIDLLGALGLILPTLTRIRPKLTAFTAFMVIILMTAAIAFHVSRGESSVIGVNIIFAIMAVFVMWGRNRWA